jgi:hypothetical protein
MTTDFGVNDSNNFKNDLRLYTSEILALMAGKKIVSAVPHSNLKAKNGKEYPGIVVDVEGLNFKVGFPSWDIRNFTIRHFTKKDVSVSVKMEDVLHTEAFKALVGCGGNEEKFLKDTCSAIIGKICGVHLSNAQTQKGAAYTASTWIVVDDADKAIVDITAAKAE